MHLTLAFCFGVRLRVDRRCRRLARVGHLAIGVLPDLLLALLFEHQLALAFGVRVRLGLRLLRLSGRRAVKRYGDVRVLPHLLLALLFQHELTLAFGICVRLGLRLLGRYRRSRGLLPHPIEIRVLRSRLLVGCALLAGKRHVHLLLGNIAGPLLVEPGL